MASLVLGGIGAWAFGPIGFLAGSLLGNLLFPQKIDNGPQSNLKLQGSEYGKMIPIGFGTIRVAGQVIWQTDLTPHKHTSGGKGGPQVTTYTYTASFAIKIAKGPAAGILRIRRNSEIIYDTTSTSTVDSGSVPVTVYLGYESALPDPTMESILGVGNVPAFRDDVVVVFTDYDLGEGGNTLGNFDFDVFFSGSPIPWRVSSFTALAHQGSNGNAWAPWYDTTADELSVGNYNDTLSLNYNEQRFLTDGTTTGTPVVSQPLDPAPSGGNPRASQAAAVIGLNAIYAWDSDADPPDRQGSWYIGSSKVGAAIGPGNVGPFGADVTSAVYGHCVYQSGYIYAVAANTGSGTFGVARWLAPDGVPSGLFDASVALTPANGSGRTAVTLGTTDGGDIFIAIEDASGSAAPELYWYDADFSTLKHHWITAAHGGTAPFIPTASPDGIRGISNFVVYNGMMCVNSIEPGPTYRATVWRINADFSFSKDPAVAPVINGAIGEGQTDQYRFSNGLVLGSDGVISLDPEQLSVTRASIVSAISGLVTLSSSDIDVSDLTDLVDGFLITSRGPAKSSLDELRVLNPPFDAVERSGQAVFVTRGGQPILTIPDDELAARDGNDAGDPGELAEIDRLDESTLPASVNVTFINSGAAYQSGSQQAIRQTALTTQGSDVNLAVAMSDTRAKQIANIVLYETWWERMPLRFSTSRKYARLEPSDVVSLRDYTVRIEKKRHTVGGVIEFEAKRSNPALYLAAPTSNSTLGAGTPSAGTSQATNVLFLATPLIADGDDGTAFYAAMAGAVDSTWRGATLYRSTDSGATWTAVATQRVASTMGTTSGALGDFSGGNVFDEINSVTVVIGTGGGTLASQDRAATMAGVKKYLIGDEIVYARDVELTAPSTYKLSGLLRGRRGTEWHMGSHLTGERFVDLSTVVPVTDPVSFRGQALQYKAVTLGGSLASATSKTFTDTGSTLTPYAPVLFEGGVDSLGDVITSWVRRTRIGGEWENYVDAPLSEASEQYVLQVWNADHTICGRVVTGLTSPTYTYLAADQVTDFGVEQQTYYLSVAELGSYGLGVQTFAAISGPGAVVNDPLVSRTPYNVAPPSSPPVTICPGSVTTDVLTWAAGVTQLFSPSDLGPGKYWVIKFTVPGGANQGGGNALGVEYASPIASRKAVLSRSPCGPPLIPTAAFDGATDVQFYFYVGANPHPQTQATLVPGETYYISITNTEIVSQMLVNFYTKG